MTGSVYSIGRHSMGLDMRRSAFLCLFWILLSIRLLLAQDWQAPLSIQVGGWTDTLYLGCRSGASDGYDSHLDTLAPPPAFGPYAIFIIASFPNYLQTDIRRGDPGTIWNLRTFNCAGKTVKIKWDLQALDAASSGNSHLELIGTGAMAALDSLLRIGDLDLKFELEPGTIVPDHNSSDQPEEFSLEIFPNPARSRVSIISRGSGLHEICIYNLLGRQIRVLKANSISPKMARFEWDRRDDEGRLMPNGIYCIHYKKLRVFISKFIALL